MTLAQSWENEGIAKGMEQGIVKGMEQGIVKGKLETAMNLFRMGIDFLTISKATELPIEEIKKLVEKKQ